MTGTEILIVSIAITVLISVSVGALIAYLIVKHRNIGRERRACYEPLPKDRPVDFPRSPDTPTEFFPSGMYITVKLT